MKKKITVLTSIILTLIIIVSTTYAYFGGRINKPNDNALAGVATKTLSLEFTDGPAIELNGVLPGQQIIKTFKVINNTSETMQYNLKFIDVSNQLSRKSDLVYSLSSTNNGATISSTTFPSQDQTIVIANDIAGNSTQEYTLTITYRNLNIDQSVDMNKQVSATIVLDEAPPAPSMPAGLYDENDQLLASYAYLQSTYNFNPSKNVNSSQSTCSPIDDICRNPSFNTTANSSLSNIISNYPTATKLVLPNTLTKIGNYALAGYGLKEIEIPASVTSIGSYAFNNSKLNVLNIPSSVTSIASNAFSTVQTINYNGSLSNSSNWGAGYLNPYIEGDFAYTDESKTKLVAYFGDSDDVVIPNTVNSIENKAFYNIYKDLKVTIPNTVTNIGSQAFASTYITFIEVPSSVTSIGSNAFAYITGVNYNGSATSSNNWGATNLNVYKDNNFIYKDSEKTNVLAYIGNDVDVVVPDSVTKVSGLFYRAGQAGKRYRSVSIPKTATISHNHAFDYASIIYYTGTSRDFNGFNFYGKCINPKTIDGDFAYYDTAKTKICSYIGSSKDIVIPNTVTSIGQNAFMRCKINTITFENNSQLQNIGSYAFFYTNWRYTPELPDSVTNIGKQAFSFTNLYKFTLPPNVETFNSSIFYATNRIYLAFSENTILKTIEDKAFSDVYNDITIPASVTTIRAHAFQESEMSNVYFANTSGWYRDGVLLDVTNPANNLTALKDSNNTDWTRTE